MKKQASSKSSEGYISIYKTASDTFEFKVSNKNEFIPDKEVFIEQQVNEHKESLYLIVKCNGERKKINGNLKAKLTQIEDFHWQHDFKKRNAYLEEDGSTVIYFPLREEQRWNNSMGKLKLSIADSLRRSDDTLQQFQQICSLQEGIEEEGIVESLEGIGGKLQRNLARLDELDKNYQADFSSATNKNKACTAEWQELVLIREAIKSLVDDIYNYKEKLIMAKKPVAKRLKEWIIELRNATDDNAIQRQLDACFSQLEIDQLFNPDARVNLDKIDDTLAEIDKNITKYQLSQDINKLIERLKGIPDEYESACRVKESVIALLSEGPEGVGSYVQRVDRFFTRWEEANGLTCSPQEQEALAEEAVDLYRKLLGMQKDIIAYQQQLESVAEVRLALASMQAYLGELRGDRHSWFVNFFIKILDVLFFSSKRAGKLKLIEALHQQTDQLIKVGQEFQSELAIKERGQAIIDLIEGNSGDTLSKCRGVSLGQGVARSGIFAQGLKVSLLRLVSRDNLAEQDSTDDDLLIEPPICLRMQQ